METPHCPHQSQRHRALMRMPFAVLHEQINHFLDNAMTAANARHNRHNTGSFSFNSISTIAARTSSIETLLCLPILEPHFEMEGLPYFETDFENSTGIAGAGFGRFDQLVALNSSFRTAVVDDARCLRCKEVRRMHGA